MAPEVWRGHATRQSDQYSLAFAYAELRLGHRTFSSTDYVGVMTDHLEKAPDLEGLPEPEQQVLFKALAKKPDDRYRTCTEFVQALERLLAGAERTFVNKSLPPVGDLSRAENDPTDDGGRQPPSDILKTIAEGSPTAADCTIVPGVPQVKHESRPRNKYPARVPPPPPEWKWYLTTAAIAIVAFVAVGFITWLWLHH